MTSGQYPIASKIRRQLTEKDSQECTRILTEVFGHADYKGKQKEIVEAAYAGADVLVVAPTGMGKSLCFQIPAIADKRGLSVVISPLLALMQNQLESLRLRNVEVAALHSQVPYIEQGQIKKQLQEYDTRIKLLYATPERMCNQEFLQLLDIVYDNHNLNRLVIDEAHCISEWGHNFREEYRRLGMFRDRYPDVPIMALTATATSIVQRDIAKSLKLDPNHLFEALHPFNRPNLFYEVRYLPNPQPLNQMVDIFEYITTLHRRRGKPSFGIIYCRFRKTCDELADYLRLKGLNARPYHRGLPSTSLEKTLTTWTKGSENSSVDIVVATIAFGLGIDKGDVRYIIHYDLPKSFEGYYQETGRSGRDSHPSKCILYYSREDALRVKKYVHSSDLASPRDPDAEPTPTQRASGSLEALIQFAETATLCRHVAICRYFGEPIDEKDQAIVKTYCNDMCDVCKYPDKTSARFSRLSSTQAALANVPLSRTASASNSASSSHCQSTIDSRCRRRQDQQPSMARTSFGAQKRGASNDYSAGSETSSRKRLKAAYMPALVTKPFGSAVGLSKPFRPPAFVDRVVVERSVELKPPPLNPPSQNPGQLEAKSTIPAFADPLDGTPYREDLTVNLPDVDIRWEPAQTAKASHGERQQALNSLRSTLHKVLLLSQTTEEIWSKIHSKPLDERKKSEIIFQVAVDLEATAIFLSSTLSGYEDRMEWRRDDVISMAALNMWDNDDPNFDGSQEIVQFLRQYSLD